MSVPLNFATRPFRNESLAALLFGLASVVLVAGTLQHAWVLKRLLSGSTSARQKEAAALEAEEATLRRRITELRPQRPDNKVLAHWSLVKDLVDRRLFSWTDLFARLEALEPAGVKLVSVRPTVKKGVVEVDVDARVRDSAEGLAFVRALEESPDFSDVYPTAVAKEAGAETEGALEFHYTMHYLGLPRRAAAGAAATPREGGEEPSDEPAEDAGAEDSSDADPGAQEP